jgi:hypothetical protein
MTGFQTSKPILALVLDSDWLIKALGLAKIGYDKNYLEMFCLIRHSSY